MATALWAQNPADQTELSRLQDGLLRGESGSYLVTVRSEIFQTTKEVQMEVFIPRSIKDSASTPVIVFYHGNTTDKNYFRTGVADLKKKAETHRFLLISPQQWWSLSGGDVVGCDDSRQAVNLLLNTLKTKGLFDPDQVYATGFSAGGLAAFLTVMNSIDHFKNADFAATVTQWTRDGFQASGDPFPADFDPHTYHYKDYGKIELNEYDYRGFASFKGNFYNGYMILPLEVEDAKAHYRTVFNGRLAFICVGGKNEAARVKTQAPEMRDFARDELGLTVLYKEYPSEGHYLSQENWNDFWKEVERRAAKP